MTVTIDCSRLDTRGHMHDELQREFSLPSYYGRNLDALWDMLTEFCGEREIILKNPQRADAELFSALARLLLELCRVMPSNRLTLCCDDAVPQREYRVKGEARTVMSLALCGDKLAPAVVYRADGVVWTQPLADWCGQI